MRSALGILLNIHCQTSVFLLSSSQPRSKSTIFRNSFKCQRRSTVSSSDSVEVSSCPREGSVTFPGSSSCCTNILPQVVVVTVHLANFFAGWVEGIILRHVYQWHFIVRLLIHGNKLGVCGGPQVHSHSKSLTKSTLVILLSCFQQKRKNISCFYRNAMCNVPSQYILIILDYLLGMGLHFHESYSHELNNTFLFMNFQGLMFDSTYYIIFRAQMRFIMTSSIDVELVSGTNCRHNSANVM